MCERERELVGVETKNGDYIQELHPLGRYEQGSQKHIGMAVTYVLRTASIYISTARSNHGMTTEHDHSEPRSYSEHVLAISGCQRAVMGGSCLSDLTSGMPDIEDVPCQGQRAANYRVAWTTSCIAMTRERRATS